MSRTRRRSARGARLDPDMELKTGEVYWGPWSSVRTTGTASSRTSPSPPRMGRFRSWSTSSSEEAEFMIIPDMLKNTPMFKRLEGKGSAVGVGRGPAVAMRARPRNEYDLSCATGVISDGRNKGKAGNNN